MSTTEHVRNWRMLEWEIVTILERQGFILREDRKSGDKFIDLEHEQPDLNVTAFAQELDLRVVVKATVTRVFK